MHIGANPLISVIVPVHGNEKTLTRCLHSLCSQYHDNLEIIVINDASPDHSSEIINSFSKIDKRMRVITNNPHAGLYETRIRGILSSRGGYITTCDADDIMPKNAIRDLYNTAHITKADLIHGRTRALLKGGKAGRKINIYDPFTVTSGRAYTLSFLHNLRGWNLWGKLYRRTSAVEAVQPLPRNKKWFLGEDLLISFMIGLHIKKYAECKQTVYYYDLPTSGYLEKSSIIPERVIGYIEILAHLRQTCQNANRDPLLAHRVDYLCTHAIASILRETSTTPTLQTHIRANIIKHFGVAFFNARQKPQVFRKIDIFTCLKNLFSRFRDYGTREVYISLCRALTATKRRGWRSVLTDLEAVLED